MTAGRRKILSVVPKRHRWLRALTDALAQSEVPWQNAVLADRMLRIRVGDAPFNLVVRPIETGMPGWKNTSLYVIGYDGAGEPNPDQKRWLDLLHEVLRSMELDLPPGLEGFASIGIRAGAPGEILQGLFPFITIEHSRVSGNLPYSGYGEIVEVLIRVTSRCNQACPFCSAPHHDEPDSEILLACQRAIDDLLPGAMVSLTGGEPTLRPAFLQEMEAALHLDFRHIQIQTNALRFADKLDPGVIPKNERLSFFVSLHALDPEVYDRCTNTSGQLSRALSGTQRILDAGHQVIINTVICRENIAHLKEMVRGFAGAFSGDNRPVLHFSVLICPEYNREAAQHLVRYSEVTEALARAVGSAREIGMELQPLLSSTHASLPACLLDEQSRKSGRHIYQIEPHETGYEDFTKPYVKAQACRDCRETKHCLGVPRPYAERFGLDELAPISAEE
jgi:pyruvate-formate lyase-activating enzyme